MDRIAGMGYVKISKRTIRKGLKRGKGPDRAGSLQDLKARTSSLRSRIQILDRRLRKMEQFVSPYPLLAFVDKEECIGCGLCEHVCPFHAISVEETARVDSGRCMGCGACVDQCPRSALSLLPRVHTRKSSKYQSERSIIDE